MTYRKGERTAARISHDFPHQVEIAIPERGLGKRLDDMYAFCRWRGVPHATRAIDFKTRNLRGYERDGALPTSIAWVASRDLPSDAFPDLARPDSVQGS